MLLANSFYMFTWVVFKLQFYQSNFIIICNVTAHSDVFLCTLNHTNIRNMILFGLTFNINICV